MLLVDEIHLKAFFDYKGGNIVGSSSTCSKAAISAFAFMISSLFSKYKDVVNILPASKIAAKDLFIVPKKTIVGLETIGFRVIAVIMDNNAVNRKALSKCALPPY